MTIQQTLKLTLGSIAACLAITAQASTTDWGVHDSLEVAATLTTIGSFEDRYLFSLPVDVNLQSTAVANNLSGVLGIADGQVTLYQEAGVVDVPLGSFAFDGSSGSVSHVFAALPTGSNYYYAVTGLGNGAQGGLYVLASSVTAVPEPETLVLMLAGLAAIGFKARRRQG